MESSQKMKSRTGICACMLGVLAVATWPAAATEFTSVATGKWSSPLTWNQAGVPGCGDAVVIANGCTVTVDDEREVTSVIIKATGRLKISGNDAPARLTICSTGTPRLEVNQSEGLILSDDCVELRFATSLTVTGSGSILGLNSGAEVVLAPGQDDSITLQTNAPIRGALVIKRIGRGAGHFVNGSTVIASDPGKSITLHSSLTSIDDTSSACNVWEVNALNASLIFDRAATDLSGGFGVGPGTLHIKKQVTTGGPLRMSTGGVIVPSAPSTFAYSGFCGCPGAVCCPSSPISSQTSCPP